MDLVKKHRDFSKDRLEEFKKDEAGNMSLIAAIAFPVMLLLLGVALTTTEKVRIKADLQMAADAAAIGATATIDKNDRMTLEEREVVAKTFFDQNFNYDAFEGTQPEFEIVIDDTDGVIVSNVTAAVNVKGMIEGFLPNLNRRVSVEASASSAVAAVHTQIHFIVDNSMSMGIGQTFADRTAMLNNSEIRGLGPEPCAVACHIPSRASHDSYDFYQSAGVRMRIDAIKEAVSQFLVNLRDEPEKSRYTKVSIMLSGDRTSADLDPTEMDSYEDNIERAITKANAIELEPRIQRGDTVLSTNLAMASSRIIPNGTGKSENSPISYVVLLTDGIENTERSEPYFYQSAYSEPDAEDVDALMDEGMSEMDAEDSARRIQIMDPSRCESVKATGATLIIMNIEYGLPERFARGNGAIQHYTLPALASWGNVKRIKAVADMKPHIERQLRRCASTPSLVYSVESEAEIERAFERILENMEEIEHVRLTQ